MNTPILTCTNLNKSYRNGQYVLKETSLKPLDKISQFDILTKVVDTSFFYIIRRKRND